MTNPKPYADALEEIRRVMAAIDGCCQNLCVDEDKAHTNLVYLFDEAGRVSGDWNELLSRAREFAAMEERGELKAEAGRMTERKDHAQDSNAIAHTADLVAVRSKPYTRIIKRWTGKQTGITLADHGDTAWVVERLQQHQRELEKQRKWREAAK